MTAMIFQIVRGKFFYSLAMILPLMPNNSQNTLVVQLYPLVV